MLETHYDVAVIGGGMAGAALAANLAGSCKVLVLERESHPGYHATGRSAALFSPTYGSAAIRALSRASRAFLFDPPARFCDTPLLTPRGVLYIAHAGQVAELQAFAALPDVAAGTRMVSVDDALALSPCLRPGYVAAALYEQDACDMDVHGLHQGYLRGIRRNGGEVRTDSHVLGLSRDADGIWQVQTQDATCTAPVIINAAGAWADHIGGLAGAASIGLQPKRRSAFVFAGPEGMDSHDWPMLVALDEAFYMKPDAGMFLGSPANADPVEPQDVQPEELDIAMGIYQIEEATTLTIRRPTRTWAGLRSFVQDGDLLSGFDPQVPGLFWVAAQGGYGIQTSPAMGQASAALVRGEPLPEALTRFGLDAGMLSPVRLEPH